MEKIGSREWNNEMFEAHPTPYTGIAGWIEKKRVQLILSQIDTYRIQPKPQIVELGCEAGHLLKAITKKFPQAYVTGVDISNKALERAQSHVDSPKLQLLQADICEPIPLKESYDFIICSETLEHIPDYKSALRQIEQLSSEESLVILTVPLESLKNFIKKVLRKLGLMKLLFKGIEEGFSSWHVQDFKEEEFKEAVSKEFEIITYRRIWGLHQLILAKKKSL